MKNTPKILISIAAVGMALISVAQQTATFARNKVRLLKQVTLDTMPTTPQSGAGCVGYVSPSGKEYAIMGVRTGNVIYNITNPESPVLVGHINGPSSLWHEVCVLGEYAYATTEAGGGIQIIDLRQVDSGIVTLAATYTGTATNQISSGHTIQAIPNSKLIVINGGNGISGLRALDCQNPTAPVQVGTWNGKYVHDAIYKQYTSGPYAGKTICFAFCANGANGGMYIIDVTATNVNGLNVPAMTQMAFIRYFPNATNFYSHSGVISPDGKYVFANDEFDEMNSLVADSSTHIINIENLSAPAYAGKFTNDINAIDHNSMVQDGFMFLAAYRSGLRIYDARNALAMTETGFFDTYPYPVGTPTGPTDGFSFDGAWGSWAGFPSGNAIISDMNRGLFVVDPSEAKGWGAPITNVAYAGFSGPADGAKKLRRDDNSPLAVDLGAGNASVIATYVTDSLNKSKVDFTVSARSRLGRQEKIRLYALRQTNGKEQLLGTWELSTQMGTFTVPNLDGATFVKGDGSVRVRLEIQSGKKGGAAVDVDLIKATVHN